MADNEEATSELLPKDVADAPEDGEPAQPVRRRKARSKGELTAELVGLEHDPNSPHPPPKASMYLLLQTAHGIFVRCLSRDGLLWVYADKPTVTRMLEAVDPRMTQSPHKEAMSRMLTDRRAILRAAIGDVLGLRNCTTDSIFKAVGKVSDRLIYPFLVWSCPKIEEDADSMLVLKTFLAALPHYLHNSIRYLLETCMLPELLKEFRESWKTASAQQKLLRVHAQERFFVPAISIEDTTPRLAPVVLLPLRSDTEASISTKPTISTSTPPNEGQEQVQNDITENPDSQERKDQQNGEQQEEDDKKSEEEDYQYQSLPVNPNIYWTEYPMLLDHLADIESVIFQEAEKPYPSRIVLKKRKLVETEDVTEEKEQKEEAEETPKVYPRRNLETTRREPFVADGGQNSEAEDQDEDYVQ